MEEKGDYSERGGGDRAMECKRIEMRADVTDAEVPSAATRTRMLLEHALFSSWALKMNPF